MIHAEGLSVVFKNRILFSDLSFDIDKGIFRICGDSGTGKTTIRNLLRQQLNPTAGRISYTEKNPVFAYCGPKATLLSEYSLNKNRGIFKKAHNEERWKELVQGLSFPYADKKLIQLSGGERRKAELIDCLSQDANYYFLDEPYAALDSKSKEFLTGFLNLFAKEHSVILINHDNTQHPIVRSSIDLNGISRKKRICKGNSRKKKTLKRSFFNPLPAFLDDRKSNLASNLICSVLSLLSRIAFVFGIAFSITDTKAERTRTGLQSDPFEYHVLDFRSTKTAFPASFYDDLDEWSIPCLTLQNRGQGKVIFYGCLKDTDYFSFYASDNGFVKEDQTLSAYGTTYSVRCLNQDELKKRSLPNQKDREDLLEGRNNYQYLFCTHSFVNEVIVHLGKGLSFSSASTDFVPLIPVEYHERTNLIDLRQGEDCVIEETNDRILSLPSLAEGSRVNAPEGIKLKTTQRSTDGKIHISSSLYRLLRILENDEREPELTYIVSRKDFSLFAGYSKDFGVTDSFYFLTSFNRYPYYCFIIAFALLISEIIFVSVSFSGIKRWRDSLKRLYRNQSFTSASYYLGILFSKLVYFVSSFIVSLLCYFLIGIPLANYKRRTKIYRPRNDGFYYYSNQPLNNYYDAVLSPIRFQHASYLILLILVLLVAFIAVPMIPIRFQKENKD